MSRRWIDKVTVTTEKRTAEIGEKEREGREKPL